MQRERQPQQTKADLSKVSLQMSDDERYSGWKILGEGGFGKVYQVFDKKLKQKVAVKLLLADKSSNELYVQSLYQEVVISRKLRHENICPIHDVYMGPRGVGIVMDELEGVDLKRWLQQNKRRVLETAGDRFEILKKITKALAYAHKQIVHRDLKPDNVFLKNSDPSQPVIMDFGTAFFGNKSEEGAGKTGSPSYMSPEHWEDPDNVDQRSDLFSLGVMAYLMFTDRLPPTSLIKIRKTNTPPKIDKENIVLPSQLCAAVPSGLDRLILQLMEYEQENRPQSTEDVCKSLEQIVLIKIDPVNGIFPGKGSETNILTRLIPEGDFYFGSQAGTGQAQKQTARKIHMSAFRIGIHPVTVGEYREFVQQTGYTASPLMDDPIFGRSKHPIVGISYYDALAFAKWSGGDLPTEAQWEYACKGGKQFPLYPWGDPAPGPNLANIYSCSKATSPVESHPEGVNGYGLFDMCGNVWEWCKDSCNPKMYATFKKGSSNPFNDNPRDTSRVLRGGSFDSMPAQGQCSARYHGQPQNKNRSIGFRIVFPVDLVLQIQS